MLASSSLVSKLSTFSFSSGEILPSKSLVLDLNDNFLIDISNISYIDKIIYQGIEFKLKNEQNLYLKEFNVNKINQLLWNIPSLLREN